MYSFKIIQNWSRDLYHSSVLTFDKKIYLFNCGDGTQRNALDQAIKLNKISNIFYNYAHTDAYLGTYGLWMSRNEQITGQVLAHENSKEKKIKKKEEDEKFEEMRFLKLWGGPEFSKNFYQVKHFFFDGIKNFINEYNYEKQCFINNLGENCEYFEDDNVKIYPLCTSSNHDLKLNENMHIDSGNKEFQFHNQNSKNNYAMSYICVPHLKSPTFLPQKAKELGLKPGPMYRELQNGKTVTLENGKEIKPSDVLGKQSPSACVGIFYSPTASHAYSLINNEKLKQFLPQSELRIFSLIVHIVPNVSIIEEEFYKDFISQFGGNTIHIIDCKETNFQFMLNEGKHKIKHVLNKVDPNLFKSFFSDEDTLPSKNLFNLLNQDFIKENKIILSSSGFEYVLYPWEKAKVSKDKIYFDPLIYKNPEFENFTKIIDNLINEMQHKQETKFNNFGDFRENTELNFNSETEPEITFLGTISMKPGKYRNVSSILVQLSEKYNKFSILMDCGEGTFQQILHHFGNKITNEILSKLKVIFITHKHGDHMLGTLKVLSEIDKLKHSYGINPNNEEISPETVIYLIAPKNILKWLQYSINNDIIYKHHIILIDCSEINPNMTSVYEKFVLQKNPHTNFEDIELIKDKSHLQQTIFNYHNSELFLKKNHIKNFYFFINKFLGINFYSIEVFHCDESYGCFIEENIDIDQFIKINSKSLNTLDQENSINKTPWKISYSGDTRPCNNFFNYSMNSSLFIHEATFDDELKNDAFGKMHSTFSEGIDLGINNFSWRIALTHFSPRYLKYVNYYDTFYKNKILICNDFLSVKLSELEWAYYYCRNFSNLMDILENDKNYDNII